MKKIKYKCRIKPSSVLPLDLIRGFYNEDKEAIEEASEWVEENGLILLFTHGRAVGHERVWVEDNQILIGWYKIPYKKDLIRWLQLDHPDLFPDVLSWTKKEMFKKYSEREISFRGG